MLKCCFKLFHTMQIYFFLVKYGVWNEKFFIFLHAYLYHAVMRKFITILLLAVSLGVQAKVERPRLVVGIVVDQMRWDYMYYYYDRLRQGGLKRLIDEGFSCENTMINYVPTVTAIGHTSIYTGTTPALHGICGNGFLNKGEYMYCCGDPNVKGVGTESKNGQMSPRNMLATTIGDQLRLSNDFKSRVFGVALKDRAAILPAGHSANAAYWFDTTVGHFISSTYYMKGLPDWLQKFNKTHTWKVGEDPKGKPEGVSLTFEMAEELLLKERLGQGNVTDMLTISISSTDAIAHEHGTRADITQQAYMAFDKSLEHFLKVLDEKVGRGQYIVFLSADHGGAHNPNFMKEHKLPAGSWDAAGVRERVNQELAAKYGVTSLIKANYGDFFYLDHHKIDSARLSLRDVKAEAIDCIARNQDLLLAVVDCENAASAPIPQIIRERICNGYNRLRSGDIYCLPRAQHFTWNFKDDYVGTTHSEWNPYDSHIPLLFYGWHVNHGQTSAPTRIVDIAPTVCEMLHIQMPNSCIGDAIQQVYK